jgi:hypothetical protein
VRSRSGDPSCAIIDGRGGGAVARFEYRALPTRLEGFTLTNGLSRSAAAARSARTSRNVVVARLPGAQTPKLIPRTALELLEPAVIDVRGYDVGARLVRTLAPGVHGAGGHSFRWSGVDASGRALPSGTYFVRLTGANRSATRKVTLLRAR